MALACEITKAGPDPEVVIEATYGWYWAVDVLDACGERAHLAHPLGVKAFAYRWVKNDVRDANDLADLLRMGRLPEAWIAPPHLRQLRELVCYRAKLVALRSALKAQVHAVLAKEGVHVPMTDLFGKQGMNLLRDTRLGTCYRMRVDSLLELIDAFDHEVMFFSDAIAARLRHPLRLQSDPSQSRRGRHVRRRLHSRDRRDRSLRVVLARHPPVGVARELIGVDQRGVGQVSEDLVVWMMRRTSIRSGSVSR